MKSGLASVRESNAVVVDRRHEPQIRPAYAADLATINVIVERAVLTWKLPERVKRLALPSYRYHAHDLRHQFMLVAELPDVGIVGVAALEEADPRDLPSPRTGLLLHGLYVDPAWQGRGIGTRLLQAACTSCRGSGHDGLLVKAQPDAAPFFQSRGLKRLPVKNPERDYPHRYWIVSQLDASTAQPDEGLPAITRV